MHLRKLRKYEYSSRLLVTARGAPSLSANQEVAVSRTVDPAKKLPLSVRQAVSLVIESPKPERVEAKSLLYCYTCSISSFTRPTRVCFDILA